MAHSGVAVEDGVVTEYNNIKLGKQYKFVQFKITDDLKRIEVEKCEAQGEYEDFVAQLPEKDCRYAVYDFHYSLGSSAGNRQQLLFIVWCPDDAKTKTKMLYASSKEALKKKLVGLALEIQATEPSELARSDLEEKLKGKSYT